MAVSGQIGEGVIKIALAGLDAAKKALSGLSDSVDKLGKASASVGGASTFVALTGSITGFLKAADPVRFEIFTQKLMILSYEIGKTFIPILKDATSVLITSSTTFIT